MIRRGADERQSQRDVDRVLERNGLDRDQRLVVIHADRAVIGFSRGFVEHGVGRQRPPDLDAVAPQDFDRRRHHLDVFHPERAVFAGMRIEARYGQARAGEAEAGLQVRHRDTGSRDDQFGGELRERVAHRKMDRHRHDRERRRPQHHHRLRCRPAIGGEFGEKFGMAGMTEAGAVQHALGDRVGDDGAGPSGPDMVDGVTDGSERGARAGARPAGPAARLRLRPSPRPAMRAQKRRPNPPGWCPRVRFSIRESSRARRRSCDRRADRTAEGLVHCAGATLRWRCRDRCPRARRMSARGALPCINDIRSLRLCGCRPDRLSASPRISRYTSSRGFPASSANRRWSISCCTGRPFPRPAW